VGPSDTHGGEAANTTVSAYAVDTFRKIMEFVSSRERCQPHLDAAGAKTMRDTLISG